MTCLDVLERQQQLEDRIIVPHKFEPMHGLSLSASWFTALSTASPLWLQETSGVWEPANLLPPSKTQAVRRHALKSPKPKVDPQATEDGHTTPPEDHIRRLLKEAREAEEYALSSHARFRCQSHRSQCDIASHVPQTLF
jgi:hypothetical protein